MGSKTGTLPVWYRGAENASVTVTPKDATASNAVGFRLDSTKGHGQHASEQSRHHESEQSRHHARH
jgi:hypothetical protein